MNSIAKKKKLNSFESNQKKTIYTNKPYKSAKQRLFVRI